MRRLAVPALLLALLAAACGGGDDGDDGSAAIVETGSSTESPYAAPMTLVPPREAPPLDLDRYDGGRFSLDDVKGKAVMVAFVYTQCPDICQVIVNALASARRQLGPDADKLAIVAVSVDPEGDTPANVEKFLASRGLKGQADYLVGTREELAPVWQAWGIETQEGATPDLIAHTGLIFGLDAQGQQVVAYPADPLDPKAIAADVPLLAETAEGAGDGGGGDAGGDGTRY